MGGLGSGWFGRRGGKITTDHAERIDIRGEDGLIFRQGGRRFTVNGARVTVTHCRAGIVAHRAWFVCPGCDSHRSVLYRTDGPWACVGCLRLAYPVEHESPMRRALRRSMNTIARAVRGGFEDPARPGGKIAWRRWPTHARRVAMAEAAAEVIGHQVARPYAAIRSADGKRKRVTP